MWSQGHHAFLLIVTSIVLCDYNLHKPIIIMVQKVIQNSQYERKFEITIQWCTHLKCATLLIIVNSVPAMYMQCL